MALDGERRAAEDARQAATLLERRRIALQTELEDVRALLDAVSSLSALLSQSATFSLLQYRRRSDVLASLFQAPQGLLTCRGQIEPGPSPTESQTTTASPPLWNFTVVTGT